jgi:hypothetical protein
MTKSPVKKTKAASKSPADKQQRISTKAGKKGPGRPFRKGESGNPRGRPPKGETLTDVLKSVMGEEGKLAVAKKLLDMALGSGRRKSYFPALKYLIDRYDGEPIKAIQATVENADLPVVLLREKQTVQDEGEQSRAK